MGRQKVKHFFDSDSNLVFSYMLQYGLSAVGSGRKGLLFNRNKHFRVTISEIQRISA